VEDRAVVLTKRRKANIPLSSFTYIVHSYFDISHWTSICIYATKVNHSNSNSWCDNARMNELSPSTYSLLLGTQRWPQFIASPTQDYTHQATDRTNKQKCGHYFVLDIYEVSANSVFPYFIFNPKTKIIWFLALPLVVYNIVVIIFRDHLKKGQQVY